MTDRTPAGFLRFDFAMGRTGEAPLCFSGPERIIAAHRMDEVVPALQDVADAVARGLYAAGYVSYDAAPAFEAKFRTPGQGPMPLVWFGIYSAPAAIPALESQSFTLSPWKPTVSRQDYERSVEVLRAAIGRGDSYQVNYSMRIRSRLSGDPYDLYRHLLDAQRGRYSAYLNLDRFHIVSASPELFFRWCGDRILTRPMKGTAPRGRWPEEDEAHSIGLRLSIKDQAENITIVDLLRNDLSRIADPGSVQVPELFQVERYPTLFQMTSAVEARTQRDVGLVEILTALFPCGSITGAPKISTMGLIAGCENTPRQVYCGAIGLLTPGGEAVFNVAIRTAVVDSQTAAVEYGTGGGVTWDSTPSGEYDEAILKARVMTQEPPQFELLETLLLEDGSFKLLERHLNRLRASGDYFDFPVRESAVSAALSQIRSAHPEGKWRVRLLVSPRGQVRIEAAALRPLPELPLRVVLAAEPVDSNDRFLFHKTTCRRVYEHARAAAKLDDPGCGVFDVLLWNEKREITEFTTGNLVVELEGKLWTPPLDCGLLAGTMRAELIEGGHVQERRLSPEDLRAATAIWFVNSIRGRVAASLVSTELPRC